MPVALEATTNSIPEDVVWAGAVDLEHWPAESLEPDPGALGVPARFEHCLRDVSKERPQDFEAGCAELLGPSVVPKPEAVRQRFLDRVLADQRQVERRRES